MTLVRPSDHGRVTDREKIFAGRARRTLRSAWRGSLVLCAFVRATQAADEPPGPRIRLEYEAEGGCPGRDAFQAGVTSRSVIARFDGGPSDLPVVVRVR